MYYLNVNLQVSRDFLAIFLFLISNLCSLCLWTDFYLFEFVKACFLAYNAVCLRDSSLSSCRLSALLLRSLLMLVTCSWWMAILNSVMILLNFCLLRLSIYGSRELKFLIFSRPVLSVFVSCILLLYCLVHMS